VGRERGADPLLDDALDAGDSMGATEVEGAGMMRVEVDCAGIEVLGNTMLVKGAVVDVEVGVAEVVVLGVVEVDVVVGVVLVLVLAEVVVGVVDVLGVVLGVVSADVEVGVFEGVGVVEVAGSEVEGVLCEEGKGPLEDDELAIVVGGGG
jgi:hypothetical protein